MDANLTGYRYTVTNLVIPSIAATSVAEVPVVLNGARLGDAGYAVPRQAWTNAVTTPYVRVTGDNAGVLGFVNSSAGAIDVADTFEFDVFLLRATGQIAGAV